ncbi:MAG: isochorismatase family protein [Gemmatimonadales bacterium]|nr:isochorismatase family protein [Gemmatimonadales bacterium]MBA3553527.1 isochorismatase family protein [Gemmatimonadales bacterium]
MERVFGLDVPQTLEETCDPQRLALIVYDMQVGVLRQIKDAATLTRAVGEVLGAAREAMVRVFFLRHMSLPKELMGVSQLRTAMAWQRVTTATAVEPWFLRDSPGFQIDPELLPRPTEAIFDKITMSAFEGTPLDMALRDCGVNAFLRGPGRPQPPVDRPYTWPLSPLDPPRASVIRGLYRHVRNPMYLAVSLIVLGEVLLTRSRDLFGYWAIWFAAVNLIVRVYEEPGLRRQFGDAYERYAAAVGSGCLGRGRGAVLRVPSPPPP